MVGNIVAVVENDPVISAIVSIYIKRVLVKRGYTVIIIDNNVEKDVALLLSDVGTDPEQTSIKIGQIFSSVIFKELMEGIFNMVQAGGYVICSAFMYNLSQNDYYTAIDTVRDGVIDMVDISGLEQQYDMLPIETVYDAIPKEIGKVVKQLLSKIK
jgi:hypothetical protein